MKITQFLWSAVAAAGLSVGLATPAWSVAAEIIGSQAGSQVNVHEYPSVSSYSPHYGLVGDRIEVLDYTEGSDGAVWFYVQFPSSGATGWVRGDFVRTYTVEGYL